jgi:hypothetical protein
LTPSHKRYVGLITLLRCTQQRDGKIRINKYAEQKRVEERDSLGQTTLLLARMQLAHNIPKHTRYILLKHPQKTFPEKEKMGQLATAIIRGAPYSS